MTWRDLWTDNAILGIREADEFISEHQPGGGAVIVDAMFDRVAEVWTSLNPLRYTQRRVIPECGAWSTGSTSSSTASSRSAG